MLIILYRIAIGSSFLRWANINSQHSFDEGRGWLHLYTVPAGILHIRQSQNVHSCESL